MNCKRCGAALMPTPGVPMRCGFCGEAQEPAADPRVAALMVDRNQNGIPDVIERMAAGGAGAGELALGGGSFRAAPVADLAFVPPAPRQPSAKARDIVFRYQGSQKVMLILGIVFTVMGTVMGSIFNWGVPVDIALDMSGRATTGTVVSTELQQNVKVNSRHPTLIHFKYQLDGAWHEGSSSTLDIGLIQRMTPGATVKLEVLPGMDGWVRVAGSHYSTFGYGTMFVLLFPLVGFFIGLSAVRSNRREIRAFVRGTPIVAQLVYQGPDTSTKLNGRHPFMLKWSFGVNGKSYNGSISHMESQALRPLVQGEQVVVLYDPGNPSINTVFVH